MSEWYSFTITSQHMNYDNVIHKRPEKQVQSIYKIIAHDSRLQKKETKGKEMEQYCEGY